MSTISGLIRCPGARSASSTNATPPDMPAASCARSGRARCRAAGHVLAAVVADALDDSQRAGVAHAEPLADDAAHEQLAPTSPRRAATLPAMTFSSAANGAAGPGAAMIRPPDRPLPT